MSDVKGTACLLYIGNTASSPSSYTVLEGQTDTGFDGSTNVADTTAKDNSGWQTGVPTTINGTVQCSGILRDSRTNLDALETAWVNRTTHACKIVFDGGGNGYSGAFYVTQLNIQGATKDVVKYQITLTPSANLTAIP